MKHACGENPRRVYGNTRMDNIWAFREVYDTARKIKEKQDAYCLGALNKGWNSFGNFPEEPKWEALVDILRGRVKVNQAILIIILVTVFTITTCRYKCIAMRKWA